MGRIQEVIEFKNSDSHHRDKQRRSPEHPGIRKILLLMNRYLLATTGKWVLSNFFQRDFRTYIRKRKDQRKNYRLPRQFCTVKGLWQGAVHCFK